MDPIWPAERSVRSWSLSLVRRRPRNRFGMENEVMLPTTIPARELVWAYGRESWVSV